MELNSEDESDLAKPAKVNEFIGKRKLKKLNQYYSQRLFIGTSPPRCSPEGTGHWDCLIWFLIGCFLTGSHHMATAGL